MIYDYTAVLCLIAALLVFIAFSLFIIKLMVQEIIDLMRDQPASKSSAGDPEPER